MNTRKLLLRPLTKVSPESVNQSYSLKGYSEKFCKNYRKTTTKQPVTFKKRLNDKIFCVNRHLLR